MKDRIIRDFYKTHPDEIIKKRFLSESVLRRYAHQKQYDGILNFVKPGMRVLDAGCGEGVLSVMMAKRGANVVGCDISEPNIKRCREYAEEEHVRNIDFVIGDAENLPFPDNSFDLVVSSHVLEHLPDFDKGLSEVMRVTEKMAVVAIPTVLNPCSMIQVGGGNFWSTRKKSLLAVVAGPLRILGALLTGKDGVNEHYAGNKEMPHIFRFPWVMKNKIKTLGFNLITYEASTLCLPLFESLLPVSRFIDRYNDKPVLRNFGYGTTFVVEK